MVANSQSIGVNNQLQLYIFSNTMLSYRLSCKLLMKVQCQRILSPKFVHKSYKHKGLRTHHILPSMNALTKSATGQRMSVSETFLEGWSPLFVYWTAYLRLLILLLHVQCLHLHLFFFSVFSQFLTFEELALIFIHLIQPIFAPVISCNCEYFHIYKNHR